MPEHSTHHRIETPKDVDDFLASRPDRLIRIAAHSPQDSEGDLAGLESKINHHLTACGCEAATVAAIIGLAASVAWLMIRPQGLWPLGFRDIMLLISAFVIPATATKGLSNLWHQRQAKRALIQLKSHYRETKVTS